MKKSLPVITFLSLFASAALAQNVGINIPNPTSALDINGGIRLRHENTSVTGLSVTLASNRANHVLNDIGIGDFTINFTQPPTEGQHVFITNNTNYTGYLAPIYIPRITTVELIFISAQWKQIGSSQAPTPGWSLTGNNGINPATQFIGTLNDADLVFKRYQIQSGLINRDLLNTSWGYGALNPVNPGENSTAIGALALGKSEASDNTAIGTHAMRDNVLGSGNTASGSNALARNINGFGNTANGRAAMFLNRNGNNNTAVGSEAMLNNTHGYSNVAIGVSALFSNTIQSNLVAIGDSALYFNGLGLSSELFGTLNTAVGSKALYNNTAGYYNTAIGFAALRTNNEGAQNTALGVQSLLNNSLGHENTAIGTGSLVSNTVGDGNSALGKSSLFSNELGNNNVAVGNYTLGLNMNGFSNVAIGTRALYFNITRSNLVAIGDSALNNNGTGATAATHAIQNTAVGSKTLYKNTTGSYNTSLGYNALFNNTGGIQNTALGVNALFTNDNGENNVAIGTNTLRTSKGFSNTAIGAGAMYNHSSGTSNVAIGVGALSLNTIGSNNLALGANAGQSETSSNKLYIDNSTTPSNKDNALIYGDFAADSLLLNAKTINKFSLNVRGSNALEMGYGAAGKQTDAGKLCYGCFGDPAHWLGIVGGGTAALGGDRVLKLWSEGGLRIKGNALPNTDNGHSLGQSGLRWSSVWAVNGVINTSDANLKTNISNSPYGLDEVMQMNPVQYNWKTNPDEDLQIGFLAQDIQKIIPEAVVVPANGDPLGMKYMELIPVLVKAIQEQQKKIDELEKMVKKLQK